MIGGRLGGNGFGGGIGGFRFIGGGVRIGGGGGSLGGGGFLIIGGCVGKGSILGRFIFFIIIGLFLWLKGYMFFFI